MKTLINLSIYTIGLAATLLIGFFNLTDLLGKESLLGIMLISPFWLNFLVLVYNQVFDFVASFPLVKVYKRAKNAGLNLWDQSLYHFPNSRKMVRVRYVARRKKR